MAARPERAGLRVRALGTATVELGCGAALTAADWGYAKPRDLVFLLVTSVPLTREQIGAALWPDLSRQQLGNALHTALREVRAALGERGVGRLRGRAVRVQPGHALRECDVDEFEAAMADAGRARPAAAAIPGAATGTRGLRGRLPGWHGLRGVGPGPPRGTATGGSSRHCSRPGGCRRRPGGTRRR